MRRAAPFAAAAALALAGPAAAPAAVHSFGHFRSVLAQGEGQTVNGPELAQNQATGAVPDTFTSQQPLYVGVMPKAGVLTNSLLGRFYKNTDFGSMPGGPGQPEHPRNGVTIVRDTRFGMAHITGKTRSDLMFGAGYAAAEERLFFMDVVRHMAEGTMAELTGPSAASDDASQLTDQDFSPAELTRQFDSMPRRLGAVGVRAHRDLLDYVAGINARIKEDMENPGSELPAEYFALGTRPRTWTPADSAASAVLLVTQFTVSNGSEETAAYMRQAFQRRFGARWRGPYGDFREAQDPEAYTVAKRTFRSDDPGRVRAGRNLVPDFGSVTPRNPLVSGPSASARARDRSRVPAWVRSLNGLKAALPHEESNAILVAPKLSATHRPLAAMGPQVGYYSPQIFSEYELHGGGIDAEGVTFPAASPWPLIGHGIDFAWSGTSANGDNEDTFAETLCNTDGTPATRDSTHYRYKGKCIPFTTRDQTEHTPFSPLDPTTPPQTIVLRTLRSVHGPVFAYATVHGKPVALTKAKAVDFHELDAVSTFMQLTENRVHNARDFMRVMGLFPGTENWFYVDNRDAAFIQSGRYPRHARGSDLDIPFNGNGTADWQGFNPKTYTFRGIPASHRPRALDPSDGFIISWNNKEAPGWRKGPSEWSNGPIHRALILQDKLDAQRRAARNHKLTVALVARAANLAATTDLIGNDVYPVIRAVIGRAPAADEKLLRLIDAWHRSGAQRLDANGDNVYEHSAAIAVMDHWWPHLVAAEFSPTLGAKLFDTVRDRVLGLGHLNWDWATPVDKDLRAVLGRRIRGGRSRVYCGGGSRARCRTALLSALHTAVAEVTEEQGSSNPSDWKLMATCPQNQDRGCDQIEPTTAGAVDTPPFPWQNRGTYHQVVDVVGHR